MKIKKTNNIEALRITLSENKMKTEKQKKQKHTKIEKLK